jgi:DNA-binding MurR/RpiR family transcriptional regulator
MSVRQQSPVPNNFQALQDAIISRWERLPKRMRQVGSYLLEHPEEVAFGSVVSISKSAQVASSALVRFGQSFGFDGFSHLQALVQAEISARVRHSPSLHQMDDIVAEGALGDTVRTALAALGAICTPQTERAIQTAAAPLAVAETIFIVANGRSHAIGVVAHGAFREVGIQCQLATRLDMDVVEVLSAAKAADVVLEIDLWSAPLIGLPPGVGRRLPRVAVVNSVRASAYSRADCAVVIGSGSPSAVTATVVVSALSAAIVKRRASTILT